MLAIYIAIGMAMEAVVPGKRTYLDAIEGCAWHDAICDPESTVVDGGQRLVHAFMQPCSREGCRQFDQQSMPPECTRMLWT